MGCLDNFIGVKFPGYADQAGYVAPVSGMFINELPGITVYSAGDIADAEKTSGIDLLQECIARATKFQEDKLNALISPSMKFVSFVDGGSVGDYTITEANDTDTANYETAATVAAAGGKGGVQIRINQKSRGAKIVIEKIEILGDTTVASRTVEINQNRETSTDTFTASLIANEIAEIEVNTEYEGPLVTILADLDGYLPNVSYVDQSACNGCGGGYVKRYRSGGGTEYCNVQGYSLNASGEGGRSSKTWGLRVHFSVTCDPSKIICALRPRLRSAMLYACGIEVAKEIMHSTRFNSTRVMTKDWAAQMLDPSMADSWQREYLRAWKDISETSASMIKKAAGDCACDNRVRKFAGGF